MDFGFSQTVDFPVMHYSCTRWEDWRELPVEARLQIAVNISRGALRLLALLVASWQVPSLSLSLSSWPEGELETKTLFSSRSALLVVLFDFLLFHRFI